MKEGQSAAAGASGSRGAETTGGSSANEIPDADEGTVPDNDDGAAAVATSTLGAPAAANDNAATLGGDHEYDAQQEARESETQPDQIAPPHDSTPLFEDDEETATTGAVMGPVPSGTSGPANDNQPERNCLPPERVTEAVSVAQVRGLTAALHPRFVSHGASGIRELPCEIRALPHQNA